MSANDNDPGQLEWTGERYVPAIGGNIQLEHLHRYYLARELARGKDVLDIACGEGYGSDVLAAAATRVYGVDVALDAIAHARRRYARPNVSFSVGTCTDIPLADDSVDVVVSFETIEHLDQHDAMMREIRRVLRPNGLLIVSSPDKREYADLPDYRNPYHVHELYRDEFEHLLASHFTNVTLVGQRIRAGSVIGPLEQPGQTRFVTYTHENGALNRTPGLAAPLYLVAFASDGDIPPVPVGLLDGGGFVWHESHTDALQQVQHDLQKHYTAQLAQMNETVSTKGAGLDLLRAELERNDKQLSEIAASNVRSEMKALTLSQRVDYLQAEIEERERRLVTVEGQRAAYERAITQVGAELYESKLRLDEARVGLDERMEAVRALEATNDRLREDHEAAVGRLREERDGVQQALDAAHAEIRARIDGHAAQTALLEDQIRCWEQAVAEYEHSTSWRLTAPFRAVSRGVGRSVRWTRAVASNSVRAVYRRLPLSLDTKMRVKDVIFRRAPFLVRHTVAYRAWQMHQRMQSALAAAPVAQGDFPVTSGAPGTLPEWFYEDSSAEYEPLTSSPGVDTRINLIAMYLPQFHPIPENDRWWGKGFTEWTNVTRGKPQFAGHYQPHLPGELGFYDLRLVDVQRRQIELAKAYGIRGFCYHHYWFGGKRLLRQPLDQLLANPDLDFPFCICWANENWTRRWDGLEEEVLIAQQHSADDDLAFIRDLEPALRDPRYIRVDGRPLLIVYRPALLPEARATTDRWRQYCREAGIGELYLMSTHAFDRYDPRDFGFDAAMEFAPNNLGSQPITSQVPLVNANFRGVIYDYRYLVEYSRHYEAPKAFPLFRTVAPMWDNEARRPGRAAIFAFSSPRRYAEWLENACRHTLEHMPETPLVFVNAWNEWAEGAHLEPDRRHGYAYLQATADALKRFPTQGDRPRTVVVSHDAYFHGAQLVALHVARTLHDLGHDVDVLLCGDGPLKSDLAQVATVHDFFSPAATPDERRRVIASLRDQGARLALCNTSVVGDTVTLLKEAGFTVVSMVHELPGLIKEHGLERSVEQIARHADRVVFPAEVVRERFLSLTGLDPSRTVIRPQGLFKPNAFTGRQAEARRRLREDLSLDAGTPIVLAVGYADTRKGIDLFVDTGLIAAARREDVCFVWVGHHDAEAFADAMARIDAAGAQSRFRFPGLVKDSDLFFAGADVYLMTSREDPFPMVVLHALDGGLPVIGFEHAGGFCELLRRGCGVLVPFEDTQAMADATDRLIEPSEEREALTRQGRDIIASDFRFADYVRALLALGRPAGPRVSVVVPNYNYAHYLPERLRSILEQTHPPHEILFLDDGSHDDSLAVADAVLRQGAVPYRILRSETNAGCYRQWLKGVREASGDLLWIAEADDTCEPALLASLVAAFEDDRVVLAYCQSRQIDEEGRELAPNYFDYTSMLSPTKWQHPYVRRGQDEIRDTLIVKNTIPNASGVVMKRPDLSAIEDRLVTLRNAGDWLVYAHLLEHGDIAYVPQSLNHHRRHRQSVTIGRGGLNLMREILLVQQFMLERHPITPDVERLREANLQAVYEYLGLDKDGPASFKDHDALAGIGTPVAG